MPEAVAAFAECGDLAKARRAQKLILKFYERDFSSIAPYGSPFFFRKVWSSIPMNPKTGIQRKYDQALHWIVDCGLIYKFKKLRYDTCFDQIISYEFERFDIYF
jgi:hypothetical protein